MFKFELHVWITFMVQGHRLMGRTVLINNMEMVGVVDDMGGVGHIPFIEIEKPVKLMIPDNFDQSVENLKQIESIQPTKNGIEISYSYKPSEAEKRIILVGPGGTA